MTIRQMAPPPFRPQAPSEQITRFLGKPGSDRGAKCNFCPTPKYPLRAWTERIEGTVVLDAIISKTGTVRMRFLESAPDVLLARAAMQTVQTWRDTPPMWHGKPVQVKTQIVVNFRLP